MPRDVIGCFGICIICTKCISVAESFIETHDQSIILTFIEWSEVCVSGLFGGSKLRPVPCNAS